MRRRPAAHLFFNTVNIRHLLSLLLPAVCPGCGRPLTAGEDTVCAACLGAMLLSGTVCDAGVSPLRERLARTLPLDVIGAFTAYRAGSVAARLIQQGKYDDRPAMITALARVYARRLAAAGCLTRIDAVQPVPMDMAKRLRRGYNQATLIAREIAREGRLPVVNALVTTRAHTAQARAGGADRLTNVCGLFECRRPALVAGRRIALVDDIITTGATLSDAATALTRAGAVSISVFTLAAAEFSG